MPTRRTYRVLVSLLVGLLLLPWQGGCSHQATAFPTLRRTGPVTQLYVDNKPFLALGGELGNSTASDLPTLDQALAECQRMHLNAVMLPVYWDLIEPEEGRFDFTLVRDAIDRARAHDLHLVPVGGRTACRATGCGRAVSPGTARGSAAVGSMAT